MQKRRGTGFGFRKAILINEHFVVYGVPAIAVPVRRRVRVTVEVMSGRGVEVIAVAGDGAGTSKPTRPGADTARGLREVVRGLGLSDDAQRYRFTCWDDLPGWSGLGSSAALCVASARAVCGAWERAASEETVNRAAFAGERVFAGNPSGIDNTVAAYGRAVWFRRGDPRPWSFLDGADDLPLVLGSSGLPSLTREQVARVAVYRAGQQAGFEDACREAETDARRMRQALAAGDLPGVGRWMDRAQERLRNLGVSSPDLDRMVDACRANGALGAKLTGAGGGGCMLALAGNRAGAERLAAELRSMGFGAFTMGAETETEEGPGS